LSEQLAPLKVAPVGSSTLQFNPFPKRRFLNDRECLAGINFADGMGIPVIEIQSRSWRRGV
jgi:hypothetical protein